MAVLTTIAVILGAWCAAAVATAALYAVLRARHVRRQRARAARTDATVDRCAASAGPGVRSCSQARTTPAVPSRTAPDAV
ncbi:hypothetical protein PV721_09280 [Streptomyces sp. MB09-01]|uniref:hypothetical protein n=1 Tax=Streptomyces sp. MB09-01 TaxID=3028666 RepID=UPI0029A96F1B|nr:hypothetical protein [Streptomyces sp. MB09-01]MDX3534559.1 hypothetical protein [Streptomyces sp. MB09-01]